MWTVRSRDQGHYTLEGHGDPFLAWSLLTRIWTTSSFPKAGITGVTLTVKRMLLFPFFTYSYTKYIYLYQNCLIFSVYHDRSYKYIFFMEMKYPHTIKPSLFLKGMIPASQRNCKAERSFYQFNLSAMNSWHNVKTIWPHNISLMQKIPPKMMFETPLSRLKKHNVQYLTDVCFLGIYCWRFNLYTLL